MIQTFEELYPMMKAQQENGVIIQYCEFNIPGSIFMSIKSGAATFDNDAVVYRIKPLLVVIDMSRLVGSGIDCEFISHSGIPIDIGPLLKMVKMGGVMKYDSQIVSVEKCRVRQNHPHAWDGRCGNPLPYGLAGTAMLRNGSVFDLNSVNRWTHTGEPNAFNNRENDIIQFTVTGTLDGCIYDNEDN